MPEWMRISELMRYLQAFHSTRDMRFAGGLIDAFQPDPSKRIALLLTWPRTPLLGKLWCCERLRHR